MSVSLQDVSASTKGLARGLARGLATGPADAALRLRAVRKVYGSGAAAVTALDGIDLTVRPGEFVALVGASGCGKSTLLSLVADLDRPTGGTVEVAGGQPALMFQQAALFPWLTAAGNVELALRLRGVGRADRKAEAARLLETVRLGDVAGRRVHRLSGGQQQRVALARCMAQHAQVLLLDEPFAALDAITRDVLHAELIAVWRRTGMSVVLVTHNVREAVRLADRVVLLSSRPGRVLAEWPVPLPHPRAIEDRGVGALAATITTRLRVELTRHA